MISRSDGWRAGAPATRHHLVARAGGDQGSATVELAVGLPVLVLLLFAALTSVSAVLTELRCVDAAREAARAAARGEAGPAAGERVAPAGATVSVQTTAQEVRAVVRTRVEPLGGRLPGFDITTTAVAAVEPTAGPWPAVPAADTPSGR